MKIILMNKNKRETRERIMAQLRQLRHTIEAHSPGLLARIHDHLHGPLHAPPAGGQKGDIPINRKKNFQTVMKFMAMRKEVSKGFEGKLKALLAQIKF